MVTIALVSFIMGSLWTLAIVNQVDAYIPYEDYNRVKLKIMHEDINTTECIEVLDKIPLEYYNNLEYIRIYRYKDDRLGQYHWWSKGIDLISGCDLYVLQHELAHHVSYERGEWLVKAVAHTGMFWDILDEIENNTRYD